MCYARSKLAAAEMAEAMCRQNEIEFSWARIFHPYGTDEHSHRIIPRAVKALQAGETKTFEYGAFMLDGENANTLFYLPPGSSELPVKKQRLLLLGGSPFGEPVLMWWNFVARTQEEITQAREDWMQHRRFGDVKAYGGSRLPAARARPH